MNGLAVDMDEPGLPPPPADVIHMPNGDAVFNLDPTDAEAAPGEFLPVPEHDDNLAAYLKPSVLADVGGSLCDAIDADLESRKEWENILANGLKYLGTNIENRTKPFKGASGVFDPVMLTANVRFQATAYGELMPAGGPVKTKVIGAGSDEASAQAQRQQAFMNLYLTTGAPEYRPEWKRMLWWIGLEGGAFKKVYEDQVLNRPVSPMIRAQDIIVPYAATDLYTTPRITHRFPYTDRDLKQKQMSGEWLATVVPEEKDPGALQSPIEQALDTAIGARPGTPPKGDKNYVAYEVHAYLNLEGFEHQEPTITQDEETGEGVVGTQVTGLPLPYRVTIDSVSRKVLSVYRNWDESDTSYQRQNYFVYYPFVPGMGFYGLGYAHLLGNTARANTALRRQIIDAETLAMMPSGVRAKGARFSDNNVQVAPLEFSEVDTGGQPIGNFLMPFSFRGASPTSLAALQESTKGAEQIASTSDIAVGEGRQDAPVGTTMALLDASTRVETSVVKGLHDSLGIELRLIADCFARYLPEGEPYPFDVPGGDGAIMKDDFNNHIDVIPVSDPNIASNIQRLVRSQAIQQMAMQSPGDYDMHEVNHMVLLDMGYSEDRILKILPPKQSAQPMDPLSENQAALMQKPIVTADWQDHAAHIAAHQSLIQIPEIAAHVAEHMGQQMRVQVQQMIGQELPPLGAPMPPQIQNHIAQLTAQAMQVMQQQAAAAAGGGGEDPQMKLAQQALQVQINDTLQKYNQAVLDSKTKITIANITSRDKAMDRASRVRIAQIKQTTQEETHGLPPGTPGT